MPEDQTLMVTEKNPQSMRDFLGQYFGAFSTSPFPGKPAPVLHGLRRANELLRVPATHHPNHLLHLLGILQDNELRNSAIETLSGHWE